MDHTSTNSSFKKTLVFIVCAVVGFIVFNLTANGIFALKKMLQKDAPQEQPIEAPAENP